MRYFLRQYHYDLSGFHIRIVSPGAAFSRAAAPVQREQTVLQDHIAGQIHKWPPASVFSLLA